MRHGLAPDNNDNNYNHLLLSTYYVSDTIVEAVYVSVITPILQMRKLRLREVKWHLKFIQL